MKNYLLSVLGLLCALSAPVHAAAIELRPEQLTIQAKSGDTVTRTIQLRLNEDVLNLRAQPMELISERQGGALPVQRIKAAPAPTEPVEELPPPKTVTFVLTINLEGVAAGEYSGALPFTYQGGELKLPLKVAVRHSPALPLLVLIGGVLASMGLSAYRGRGRPRDQVVMRMELLRQFIGRDRALASGIPRNQSEADADALTPVLATITEPPHPGLLTGRLIPNPFKARILTSLIEVELCLQSERWEEARAKLDEADALLRKWIAGRLGWIYQIAYLGRLEESLAGRAPHSRYLQGMRSALSDLIANAPSEPAPQAMREATQRLTARLADYQRLDAKLQTLESLRSLLRPELETSFTLLCGDLRARLEDLRPEAADAAALGSDIDQALKEFTDKLKQSAGEDGGQSKGVRTAALESRPAPSVEPIPDSHLEWHVPGKAAEARSRLRFFVLGSYAIALGLLAGSGFNEIYAKNLTFGADLWVDYLALVLWGFGAEATRDSIASTLRSLGIPLEGRNGEAKA